MILPVELYGEIFSYIDNKTDLCSLLLTNRTLSREAEAVLYQDVEINGAESLLFKTLTVPHRATLIHQLTINLGYNINFSLRDLLHATTQLHHLLIFSSFSRKLGWVFIGCSFQLRTLRLPSIYTNAITTFFSTQKYLHTVQWDGPTFDDNSGPAPDILPHSALPALTILSGNSEHLSLLLPGRSNITRLYCKGDATKVSLQEFISSSPTPTLASLRVFSIGRYTEMFPLRLLSTFCPNLEILECWYSVDLIGHRDGIPLLRSLKELYLHDLIYAPDHRTLFHSASSGSLVPELFARNISLRRLEIDEWLWTRGAVEAIKGGERMEDAWKYCKLD